MSQPDRVVAAQRGPGPRSGRVARAGRAVVACGVFGVYIGLGFAFHLDANVYLLLGIPFTLLFPLVLARRPVRELWVRGTPPPVDRWVWLMFAALAVLPGLDLAGTVGDAIASGKPNGPDGTVLGYDAAALLGAFVAAWSIRALGRAGWRRVRGCLATAGILGAGMFVGGFLLSGQAAPRPVPWASLGIGLASLLMYVPVVFVLEEVFFRGALDSYLHRDGEPGARWTAALCSALWGLWHLPVAGSGPITAGVVLALLAFQIPVGIFLSLGWRRSGNLAVPGITHAAIDAVRNGLGF